MSEDTRTLEAVLADAESFLGLILEGHQQLLPERLRGPLVEAWRSVQPRFVIVRATLADPSEQLQRDLAVVGLTGVELAMKVTGYYQARERADVARREQATVRAKAPPRGLGWLFQRVLAWLNTILGSLGKVIPGVDAIKEFKEGIENGIKDNEPPPKR